MKKILICSLLAIVISNCEVKVRSVIANGEPVSQFEGSGAMLVDKDIQIHGMIYHIWYINNASDGRAGFAISVVNVTKDLLEVQKLQKELSK